MAEFLGAEYSALVNWLCDEWWNSGPGICIVEGFPGVGKTRVAEEAALRLQREQGVPTAWSECPETQTGLLDDLTLVLAESFSQIGDDRLAESLNLNVVPDILAKPTLLVIDEFQRSLIPRAGRPESGFASWLARVCGSHGRVILLSSRDIDRGRWSERLAIRRLTGLQPKEGAILLSTFIEEEGLSSEEIPVDRREEVVKWLGGFPRALHLLVTRLRYESIDDLIGLEPEAWECRNRDVSPDFLRRFEEELLSRARSNLDESVNRFFERLAVYRRPVDRHALHASNQGFGDVDQLRDELIRRFMLERRRQFFSMHPVLRETVLAQMDDAVRKSAHRIAGEHYGRHFKAQQIVGFAAKLGAAFIEARYHLSQGEDIENLKFVVIKFESYIRALFGWVTPIPFERVEIDERISLLLALLHEPGAKGLHYYLARLLEHRDAPGDLDLAVQHARHGTGPQSPDEAWLFRMRVEERFNGIEAAIAVAREGIRRIPLSQPLYQSCGELLARENRAAEAIELLKEGIRRIPLSQPLYQSCGELLARENRAAEAIELLKEGIGKIPPTQNLFSLYQSCGELLARENRAAEAIELLKEGIRRIPLSQPLYQSCGELLARENRAAEAIELLKEGIGKILPTQSLFSLYQSCGELLARENRAAEAIELLKEGIGKILPTQNLFSLYQSCGELLARENRAAEAIELLKEGIGKIPPTQNLFSLYQSCGELLARENRAAEAIELLKEGIGRIPPAQNGYRVAESAILISAAMRRRDWIDNLVTATGSQQLSPPQRLLAEVQRLQIAGEWNAAAEKASLIDKINAYYLAVYAQESFSWLCADQPDKAQSTLDRFPSVIQHSKSNPTTWLACFIALRRGDGVAACELYTIFTGLSDASGLRLSPSESDLLRIWDSPRPLSTPHPAYYFPTLPSSLTGLNESITRSPQGESVLPAEILSEMKGTPHTIEMPTIAEVTMQTPGGILSIATEWFSRHGGMSTFNRELCISLARIGQYVVCLVPTASEDEKNTAKESGVTLITAPSTTITETAMALLRRPQLPEGFIPSIVIGHGRITGPFAEAQVTDNFQKARRVHFVHMIASEIEWYKGNDGAAKTAEERERFELNLCRNAALVAAVGPRICRETATLMHGLESPPTVHCFNPGILPVSGLVSVPPGIQCLLLGRAEDLELKGLDIAAKALAGLPHPEPRPFESTPALIVRGAPEGTGSKLRATLIQIAEKQIDIRVREYTSDVQHITEDLRRASVLLMPSRVEGFGLVATEALALGIPILVSNRSGFGELLNERLQRAKVVQHVIQTTGDLQTDAPEWSRALEAVLRDREAAFRRARELRDELAVTLSWDAAASALLKACSS